MGYRKIENLYRKPEWLQLFKMVWVTQKIHGSSAHILFSSSITSNGLERVSFFAGGASHALFTTLFNKEELLSIYKEHYAGKNLTLYGEVYGGNMHSMKHTYGDKLSFIAFDCELDGKFLDVPHCKYIADLFKQDFVWHKLVENTIENLNFYRDMPSQIATQKGLGEKKEEGIVVRPMFECFDKQGGRWMAKHKRDDFSEMRTPREVDPNKAQDIWRGQLVADEFVTPMRLIHVLDKHPEFVSLQDIPKVIQAVIDDLNAECEGEIAWSNLVVKAVSGKTVSFFKSYLNERLLNVT